MDQRLNRIKELAESIAKWNAYFKEAITLYQEAFSEKFQNLSSELQEQYLAIQAEYFKYKDQSESTDPALRIYYRKAAWLFHPDIRRSNDKENYFKMAQQAYEKGDIVLLQELVFQELAENFNGLTDSDREFLFSESETMASVSNRSCDRAMELVVSAGQISVMSQNYFTMEINDAIRTMRQEMEIKGNSPEIVLQIPSLLERGK